LLGVFQSGTGINSQPQHEGGGPRRINQAKFSALALPSNADTFLPAQRHRRQRGRHTPKGEASTVAYRRKNAKFCGGSMVDVQTHHRC
jgi:hypothetical protein